MRINIRQRLPYWQFLPYMAVMKIKGTSAPTASAKPKRTGARSGGETFSVSVDQVKEASSSEVATSASPVAAVDMILALQQDEGRGGSSGTGTRPVRAVAENILDELETLRRDVILGRVNPQRLSQVVSELQKRKNSVLDPDMRAILDDIELRASVELAKLGLDPFT
ncbi:MAG: flagellar assembly protein FliX [Pseudomonadota bacterium]